MELTLQLQFTEEEAGEEEIVAEAAILFLAMQEVMVYEVLL